MMPGKRQWPVSTARVSRQLLPVEQMARLYEAGWSADRIAVDAGISGATVTQRLRDSGVQLRPRRGAQRGLARRRLPVVA